MRSPFETELQKAAVIALIQAIRREWKRWSSAEVTIEADGTYKFHFSYDAPKRINGTLDDDSNRKFAKLAEKDKAERASGK
jgi:hypothetical protein